MGNEHSGKLHAPPPRPLTCAVAVVSSIRHRPLKRDSGSLVANSLHSLARSSLVTVGCGGGKGRRKVTGPACVPAMLDQSMHRAPSRQSHQPSS